MSDVYRSGGFRRAGVLRAFCKSSSLKAIFLSGASLTLAASLVGPASAQDAQKRYPVDIEPSSMVDAIKNIERETGVAIVYSPNQVQGMRTQGVVGNLSIGEALNYLVKGAGLSIRQSGDGTYVIAAPWPASSSSSPETTLLRPVADMQAAPEFAQASASAAAPAATPEQVIVTGTQVLRDGFSSPTPLTVLSPTDLQATSPTNLSDYLDKLPALAGSTESGKLG